MRTFEMTFEYSVYPEKKKKKALETNQSVTV